MKRALHVRRAVWMALLVSLPAVASAATIDTVAGTGGAADGPAAGAALQTNVGQPFGVELGADGGLYICEVQNHRVRRLDLESGRMTTVAGCGRKGYAGDGGPATDAELNEPYEVRFDDAGNMFFVEMQNHLIRRVDAKTGHISTVAGSGQAGFSGDGGPALEAQFTRPHSIALDGRGGLYVADIGNHRVRRIDLAAGTIETIAGNGKKTLPVDGQTARGRPLLGPRALFVTERNLWIALREGHSVWRLDLDKGTLHHVAGSGKKGFDRQEATAAEARFNGPKGIAVGPQGHLYVVDTENQAIRQIDVARDVVTTLAGGGPQARGYGGDNGPATAARLDRPHGICIGPEAAVYIGDTNNHRVRRVRQETQTGARKED